MSKTARIATVAAVLLTFCAVASPASAEGDRDQLYERSRAGSASTPKQLTTGEIASGTAALMRTQERLDAVADRIEAVSRDIGSTGLGGLEVDAAAGTVYLYWHGDLSPAVQQQVAAAERTGLTVQARPAPYTRSTLRREADRLTREHMTGAATDITSIGPKADGTGLKVGIAGLNSARTDSRSRAASIRQDVTSAVPVEFTSSRPQTADRWFDSAPYWGGAFLMGYSSSSADWESYFALCTSGFGVTGNNGAATYIMFANHCGAGQWRTGAVTDSTGAIIQHVLGNTIVTRDVAHDTQLILTSQGAGLGVYTGESWLGSGQSGRAVRGSAANHVGDYICTEGSFSGTICDIRVVDTGSTINVTGYGQMRDMVTANNIYYEDAAGNGDSGGPVVSVTTGGVLARGTISAMNADHYVECFGVPGVADNEDGRHCSWEIFYPDIQYQLSGVGVHLNTN